MRVLFVGMLSLIAIALGGLVRQCDNVVVPAGKRAASQVGRVAGKVVGLVDIPVSDDLLALCGKELSAAAFVTEADVERAAVLLPRFRNRPGLMDVLDLHSKRAFLISGQLDFAEHLLEVNAAEEAWLSACAGRMDDDIVLSVASRVLALRGDPHSHLLIAHMTPMVGGPRPNHLNIAFPQFQQGLRDFLADDLGRSYVAWSRMIQEERGWSLERYVGLLPGLQGSITRRERMDMLSEYAAMPPRWRDRHRQLVEDSTLSSELELIRQPRGRYRTRWEDHCRKFDQQWRETDPNENLRMGAWERTAVHTAAAQEFAPPPSIDLQILSALPQDNHEFKRVFGRRPRGSDGSLLRRAREFDDDFSGVGPLGAGISKKGLALESLTAAMARAPGKTMILVGHSEAEASGRVFYFPRSKPASMTSLHEAAREHGVNLLILTCHGSDFGLNRRIRADDTISALRDVAAKATDEGFATTEALIASVNLALRRGRVRRASLYAVVTTAAGGAVVRLSQPRPQEKAEAAAATKQDP